MSGEELRLPPTPEEWDALRAENDRLRARVTELAVELHRLAVEAGVPDRGPRENVSTILAELQLLRAYAEPREA